MADQQAFGRNGFVRSAKLGEGAIDVHGPHLTNLVYTRAETQRFKSSRTPNSSTEHEACACATVLSKVACSMHRELGQDCR